MGINRHKPEEIVTNLRQVEVLVGHSVAMTCLRCSASNIANKAGRYSETY